MVLTSRPSCSMRLQDERAGKARPPPFCTQHCTVVVTKGKIEFEVRNINLVVGLSAFD